MSYRMILRKEPFAPRTCLRSRARSQPLIRLPTKQFLVTRNYQYVLPAYLLVSSALLVFSSILFSSHSWWSDVTTHAHTEQLAKGGRCVRRQVCCQNLKDQGSGWAVRITMHIQICFVFKLLASCSLCKSYFSLVCTLMLPCRLHKYNNCILSVCA